MGGILGRRLPELDLEGAALVRHAPGAHAEPLPVGEPVTLRMRAESPAGRGAPALHGRVVRDATGTGPTPTLGLRLDRVLEGPGGGMPGPVER